MTAITYVAVDRGTLYTGHTAGNSYDLETAAQQLDRVRKAHTQSSAALDRTTETNLDAIERGWQTKTDLLTETERQQWEEFIDSVAAGEAFTYDANGTIASPDNPQTVIMVGDAQLQRVGSMYYTYSFKVEIQ